MGFGQLVVGEVDIAVSLFGQCFGKRGTAFFATEGDPDEDLGLLTVGQTVAELGNPRLFEDVGAEMSQRAGSFRDGDG